MSVQPAASGSLIAELAAKEKAMRAAKAPCMASRDAVRKSRWLHEGNTSLRGNMGNAPMYWARAKEGDAGIVWGIGAVLG